MTRSGTPGSDVLAAYYRACGRDLPRFTAVSSSRLPPIQRRLLDHDSDMTPTLAAHHGAELSLNVLRSHDDGAALERTVTLVRATDGVPVAFGAIRIELGTLPETACAAVRTGHRPLGALLAAYEIRHTSHPQAFFQVTSDALMVEALACAFGVLLAGRYNELRDAEGAPLARVVEILPPESR